MTSVARSGPRALGRATVLLLGAWVSAAAQANAGSYASKVDPRADIRAALESAQQDHKPVLLDFGADWCLDCRVLDTLMRDTSVAPFVRDHFHVVRIYVGMFDSNVDVAAEYGDPIYGGIPAIVVLAPDGRKLASTRDGTLESAHKMTTADLAALLERWTHPPRAPTRFALSQFTESEVSVALSLERAPDGELTLIGTFSPDRPGFHLYGKDLPLAGLDGIGRPTLLVNVQVDSMTHVRPHDMQIVPAVANGVLVADRAPVSLSVPSLGKVFPVYPAGPVTLRLPIAASAMVNTLVVSVTYEACSDALCLAPVIDKRVKVAIPPAAR